MRKILVINAGSSSLKYQVFNEADETVLAKGLVERIGINDSRLKHKAKGQEKVIEQDLANHSEAVKLVLDTLLDPEVGVLSSLEEIVAVGHRVVHGGEHFAHSVLITEEVKQAIKDCYALAPLHNPANMTGIEAMESALPKVPQVAVFDTAFHQTMPCEAFIYAIPYRFYEENGVRRYGFHGTSHAFVSARCAEILQKPNARIITCHLGNGSSLAAVKDGKCYDTSMGMTPLAGVPMGTRCGDIDPAIVTFIQSKENLDAQAVDRLLNKESGVHGISGVGSDFRDLDEAAKAGNSRAALARAHFAYRVKSYIGAYMAVLGGLDAIVFTAGIGENDCAIREQILTDLEGIGVEFDAKKNAGIRGSEAEISTPDSRVKVFVIPTNEELAICRDTARLAK